MNFPKGYREEIAEQHSTSFNKIISPARACDDPSVGSHIASFMSVLPGSNPMRLFLVGLFEVQVYLGGVPMLTTLTDNALWTVLSIPGDMLLSAVENVVCRMQCVVHEKWDHTERGFVVWRTETSSL
ncbi:hypothetical protein AVEN_218450-1 [Araneus ventricosus]|uniref:Uncharacterized protein n=1 Tax=Araneus ventricosus TaxID=182803 RepID=A0A4Y2KVN1_ARAVE|nr:hypothetical protein AVEN_218450-1 [Araneus ventricosus]